MMGRANLLRGLAALSCLAAASCAELTEQPTGRTVTGPEPVPAMAAATSPTAAEDASTAAGAGSTPAADPGAASVASSPADAGSSATRPEPAAPSGSTAEISTAPAAESPLGAAVPSAIPAEGVGVAFSRAAPPPADTLDFAALVTRLRKTKAIGLLTKVAVKNQSNDLLDEFRAYHTQHGTATLTDLRRSYDSLFYRLHSLLQDADPPLARDIDRSRAAIWEILSDRRKFTASRLMSGA